MKLDNWCDTIKNKTVKSTVKDLIKCKYELTDNDTYFLGVFANACKDYGVQRNSNGFIEISRNFPIVLKHFSNITKYLDDKNYEIVKLNLSKFEYNALKESFDFKVFNDCFNKIIEAVFTSKMDYPFEFITETVDHVAFKKCAI